jgi:autotransporter translocation and assembly factor TamB
MSRRWAWWTAGGLLVVVLLAFGAWRLSREIPDQLRKAEEAIRKEAARVGLRVSYRNLRIHFFYPRVSMDNLAVVDEGPGIEVLRAESVDVSLSPGRLLSGESPVSRIRLRKFALHAEEANRPLFDRMRAGKRTGPMPEILLLGGIVRLGPFGPLRWWEAKIPEMRLREVKFLGTRLSLSAEDAKGEIDLPGAVPSKWPFGSLEADLYDQEGVFRIRRIRATGDTAIVRISGSVDPARKSGDVKLSGGIDVARWISAGAPFSPWLGRVAEKGNVDFSAALAGSLEDPTGSGKLILRNGRIRGNSAAEAELVATVSKKKIRVETLKGKLLGGVLSGSGSYDLASRRGEGKLSLSRASLGTAPWREWGFDWRPAGAGNLEIALSGNRERIHAAFSLNNPEGLERAGEGKRPETNLRIPLAATATADYSPDGRIAIPAFQLRVRDSTLSGRGEVTLPEKNLRFVGEFAIPRGKALDYGWDYPLSWGRLSGRWEAEGPASRPRFAVRMEAQSFAARALPPVPFVVKAEGDPADAIHFVVDIPAAVAKTTATGTFTGPLSAKPFAAEADVAVRDIDFSEGPRWLAAVLVSLGKEPDDAARYAAGMAGSGSADLQVTIAPEAYSFTGSLHSPELRIRGIRAGEVSMEGEWKRSGNEEAWKATVGGKVEEGTLRMTGEGKSGAAEISGSIDHLDIGQAISSIAREKGPFFKGSANIRFAARKGEKGWELNRFSASVPRLSVDNTVLEGVSAEGSLGAATGVFLLAAQSPGVRLTADVLRGGEWPVSFTLSASGVPTDFLLSAAGRAGLASSGKWSAEAEGTVSAAGILSGKTFSPDAVSAFRFSLSATSPSFAEVGFEEMQVNGKKEGDAFAGEVRSRNPDTRLAFSVSLREPLGFRVEGPFSFATAANGKGKEEQQSRFALSGTAEIRGSLRALSKTTGSLLVRQFLFREGSYEITGKEISATMSAEGVRWAGGTLMAVGSPLIVSGKVSWNGDLEARLEGKLPASAIRFVTDVFDRLDGTMQIDLRVAGKWDNPSMVGTGRLENGVFSFRGYAQLFEAMQVEALISREKLVFEHFEGKSGGGYLDGRGELPLRFDAHQRLYFSVDFFDMRFPYPDDFRPVLQGHVELLGPYDDFLVTGDVEVQSARYTKTIRPERAFVDFRKRLEDVTARRGKSDFRVRLDVNAVADGTIRIKNNLADAQAKGEFKVAGDAGRVIILGAFDVIEGFVEYQGNRYELKRVSVEFQDPRRNNPRLDARAETRKGNVTVTVSVTGTLEKYEVDLTSDPPLSKNDLVSLLSLGVTSQALAGSTGTVGAGVASSFVLGPYKGKFEEGVRGIVKLDKFAIEPAFSASSKSFEPKFIVGKSFGEKFSVSVSSSVGTTPENSATAEYKLLENLFLSGAWESSTTTTEGDLGADVKIRYRYRDFKDFLSGRD